MCFLCFLWGSSSPRRRVRSEPRPLIWRYPEARAAEENAAALMPPLEYSAPECVLQHAYSTASDMYSLGHLAAAAASKGHSLLSDKGGASGYKRDAERLSMQPDLALTAFSPGMAQFIAGLLAAVPSVGCLVVWLPRRPFNFLLTWRHAEPPGGCRDCRVAVLQQPAADGPSVGLVFIFCYGSLLTGLHNQFLHDTGGEGQQHQGPVLQVTPGGDSKLAASSASLQGTMHGNHIAAQQNHLTPFLEQISSQLFAECKLTQMVPFVLPSLLLICETATAAEFAQCVRSVVIFFKKHHLVLLTHFPLRQTPAARAAATAGVTRAYANPRHPAAKVRRARC
jgi:hypothetical protein